VVFDWDGTAVADRRADAASVRAMIESLVGAGVHVAIVTGTHAGNVDGQLAARPAGPGRLLLACNRGSELFAVDSRGPLLLDRRTASAAEDAALDRAAADVVAALAERGLTSAVVTARMNRRKIDLIPEPGWRDPPKSALSELVAAVTERLGRCGIGAIADVVEIAVAAARAAGLPGARVTSDAKHVEIGLTDKADAARAVFARLWDLGVAPPLVLVVGDEFGELGGVVGSDACMIVPEAAGAAFVSVGPEPAGAPSGVVPLGGGPAAFLTLLADQMARRVDVPRIAMVAGWSLSVAGIDLRRERSDAALLALGNGRIGTTGAPLVAHPATDPGVLVAGIYTGTGPATDLLSGPLWDRLAGDGDAVDALTRTLDLRTGVLAERLPGSHDAVRFVSLARPGTVALRATGPAARAGVPLAPPQVPAPAAEQGRSDHAIWLAVRGTDASITAAAVERENGGNYERFVAYTAGPGGPQPGVAAAAVDRVAAVGFDALAAEQRAAWAQRWATADVRVEGDPGIQRAIRVAAYHLMAAVADAGEAPVGARGLTGPAYRGHVFWDADLFVLPFLAATHAPAARAMLEYRIRRLPAARRRAASAGLGGARFPWESAGTGDDVTPGSGRDQSGRIVPIRTGDDEVHIVGAVALAAAIYEDWTGDRDFAVGPGRMLMVETARFWATRIRVDRNGYGHFYGVIGPDEYHEPVDDNAYTNVLARWNLRRAARVAAAGEDPEVSQAEVEHWCALADAIIDGYDPDTGHYEQFAGFGDLEPLVIADLAPRRPITADLLLGRERVRGAQIVKQADVLMLHHLLPDEMRPGSLGPDLDYFEPRTAHGSSLSPAIHAAVLARAGRVEAALEALEVAAGIDLVEGGAAGGVHLGAMGGLWQALALGFLGLRPRPEGLEIDPRLPDRWSTLEVRCSFRGTDLVVRAERDSIVVGAAAPSRVVIDGGVRSVGVGESVFPRPAEVEG